MARQILSGLMKPKTLAATVLLSGVLVVPLWMEQSVTAINHYAADDLSSSALDLESQREAHCQASIAHYKSGDRRVDIQFAELPEITNDQQIENTFLFNPCGDVAQPSVLIGKEPGTSLPRLVNFIASQVNRDRLSDPDARVVVTVTLHFAETMPGQPALDAAGYEDLRSQLTSITQNNQGVVAIIGPGGALQNQLMMELAGLPNVRVCAFNATRSCVDWAFATARH